jgi:uncharacterized membrane protein
MHGATTHFPIALTIASVLFDFLAILSRDESRRAGFHTAASSSIMLGAVISFGAVGSGLILSRGEIFSTGMLAAHHGFVWPAFALLIGAAVWRALVKGACSPLAFRIYFATVCLVAVLVSIAGFWGGELLVAK